jgi:hypothetical protein
MDPNLYYAMVAVAGVVVSGGFTYWAGNRLLGIGERRSGRGPAGERREPDQPSP